MVKKKDNQSNRNILKTVYITCHSFTVAKINVIGRNYGYHGHFFSLSLLNARICVSGPIGFLTAVEQTSHETYFALSKTLVPLSADIITAEKKKKKKIKRPLSSQTANPEHLNISRGHSWR